MFFLPLQTFISFYLVLTESSSPPFRLSPCMPYKMLWLFYLSWKVHRENMMDNFWCEKASRGGIWDGSTMCTLSKLFRWGSSLWMVPFFFAFQFSMYAIHQSRQELETDITLLMLIILFWKDFRKTNSTTFSEQFASLQTRLGACCRM